MSAWKTGTPTESGYYLVKYARLGKGPKFDVDQYNARTGNWYWFQGRVIKWTEIPEDNEEE